MQQRSFLMTDDLVCPRERTLGNITLVLGILAWLALIIGTVGGALIGLAIGFLVYLFLQSALISHIKGNGVELSEAQFPDQFVSCCEVLKIKSLPQAYVLNGNGGLNAFATKFLKTQYVVLMSDVVDAMDKHPDGVRFYLGHELGHLRMKHLSGHLLRWPVMWLPLLGAAYSRARESTCDRHGLACSATPEGAARALAALAAGSQRWQQLDVAKYVRQAKHTAGFWMSFHELTAGYPWLTKRAARLMNPEAKLPPRNALAYVVAAFIPYAGRLGGGFGFLIVVYIVGVLAATAIPAYQDYTGRTKMNAAYFSSQSARDALGGYYQTHKAVPESLDAVGIAPKLLDGTSLSLDADNMVLTVLTRQGELIFTPQVNDQGRITWRCLGGEKMKPTLLPAACKP
jgi:Zn-dependent protease with chaperone function/type II secretory pathway pseudopilin PulG